MKNKSNNYSEMLQDLESLFVEQNKDNPFSEQAKIAVFTEIGNFITDLISQSIKKFERGYGDNVSESDVQNASSELVTRPSKKHFDFLNTLGGIIFGAGLSVLANMYLDGNYTNGGVLFSFIGIGLGIIFIMIKYLSN